MEIIMLRRPITSPIIAISQYPRNSFKNDYQFGIGLLLTSNFKLEIITCKNYKLLELGLRSPVFSAEYS